MTTDELQQEHWLVAYEANVKAWLPSHGAVDSVGAHPAFAALKAAGVHFYDAPQPGGRVTAARPLPGGAIGMFYA